MSLWNVMRATVPYMMVPIPTAGLPLTCSIPGCKWWGRTTNDYTKHTRSDGHKAKSTLSPAVTGETFRMFCLLSTGLREAGFERWPRVDPSSSRPSHFS